MDDPTNLLRFDAAVLDQLRLEAQTRTYVLVSKHSESWGILQPYWSHPKMAMCKKPIASI